MTTSDASTNVSLLGRIQQSDRDEDAWKEFVERYGKRIFQWCVNRKLRPDDAEDVTQEVLIRMCKYLHRFRYDNTLSFTGYLRRATENAVTDFLNLTNRRESPEGGSSMMSWMNSVEAREELSARLKEAFDLELLERAMSEVQNRVNEGRWNAWYETSIKHRNPNEVATELGMGVASLYAAKNQVGKMVMEEIQRLENPRADFDT